MICGWDISTSIVGFCAFDDLGHFLEARYCDLRKFDGLLAKADEFRSWIDREKLNINIYNTTNHFVEERLAGFAVGRTSAQTLMRLGQFNAIVSYILWTLHTSGDRTVQHIYPVSWKSLMKREGLLIPKGADKKELTLAFVRRKEPGFPVELNRNGRIQPWCYDMADAYCIGRAGYLRTKCTERENSRS